MRTWLTMIGIFIGIAAVVALISLGQGFKQAVNKEFEKIGTDKLFITAKNGFGPPGSNAVNPLTEDDLRVVKSLAGIEKVSGLLGKNTQVTFRDDVGFFPIYGIPEGDEMDLLEETQSLEIERGRNLRDSDSTSALVGIKFVENELLGRNLKLRDKIEVNGEEFTVVGISRKTGDPVWDGSVFIPEQKLRDLFDEEEKLDMIMVKAASVDTIDLVSDRVSTRLRQHRGVKEGEEDFDVETPDEMLASFEDVLTIINVVLVGIAGISLLVGGIGIANTMYTSVVERTKEIGIMKSIGAQKKDILLIFIIESGMLGAFGGFIGVVSGFSLSIFVEFVAKNFLGTNLIEAYMSFSLFFGALFFSFLMGAFFGMLPARRAANMHPVKALKFK